MFLRAIKWTPVVITAGVIADISRYDGPSIYDSYQFPSLIRLPPEYVRPFMYDHALGHFLLRNTLFKVFCDGESLSELQSAMLRLQKLNIGTIADYSVEQDDQLIDTLEERKRQHEIGSQNSEILKQTCLGDLSAVKLTALGPAMCLQRVTNLILDLELKYGKLKVLSIFDQNKQHEYLSDKIDCTEQDLKDFNQMFSRLGGIVDHASKCNTQITVDAEQSYFQPAISLASTLLAKAYNSDKSVVLPTFQLYLKRGIDDLKTAIAFADDRSYIFGCKIVRGAYLNSERVRANELNVESPINETIEDTHRDFNYAIKIIHKYSTANPDCTHVIASHNYESMKLAQELFKNNKKNAILGQLLGMHDSLTYNISVNEYRAYKYVPFGPLEDVMPYLLRRAVENNSVLSANQHEFQNIKAAIWRKLLFKV